MATGLTGPLGGPLMMSRRVCVPTRVLIALTAEADVLLFPQCPGPVCVSERVRLCWVGLVIMFSLGLINKAASLILYRTLKSCSLCFCYAHYPDV